MLPDLAECPASLIVQFVHACHATPCVRLLSKRASTVRESLCGTIAEGRGDSSRPPRCAGGPTWMNFERVPSVSEGRQHDRPDRELSEKGGDLVVLALVQATDLGPILHCVHSLPPRSA